MEPDELSTVRLRSGGMVTVTSPLILPVDQLPTALSGRSDDDGVALLGKDRGELFDGPFGLAARSRSRRDRPPRGPRIPVESDLDPVEGHFDGDGLPRSSVKSVFLVEFDLGLGDGRGQDEGGNQDQRSDFLHGFLPRLDASRCSDSWNERTRKKFQISRRLPESGRGRRRTRVLVRRSGDRGFPLPILK